MDTKYIVPYTGHHLPFAHGDLARSVHLVPFYYEQGFTAVKYTFVLACSLMPAKPARVILPLLGPSERFVCSSLALPTGDGWTTSLSTKTPSSLAFLSGVASGGFSVPPPGKFGSGHRRSHALLRGNTVVRIVDTERLFLEPVVPALTRFAGCC